MAAILSLMMNVPFRAEKWIAKTDIVTTLMYDSSQKFLSLDKLNNYDLIILDMMP